mgnify:CR=1 FL=1
MTLKGRIYKVFPVQQGTSAAGNKWAKQDFIFEYFEHPTDRYTDKVLLSCMNDRIREYDIHEGDEVRIGFGHRVREYNGRYFNEVSMYHFEKVADKGGNLPADGSLLAGVSNTPQNETKAESGEKKDDLPF